MCKHMIRHQERLARMSPTRESRMLWVFLIGWRPRVDVSRSVSAQTTEQPRALHIRRIGRPACCHTNQVLRRPPFHIALAGSVSGRVLFATPFRSLWQAFGLDPRSSARQISTNRQIIVMRHNHTPRLLTRLDYTLWLVLSLDHPPSSGSHASARV